MNSVKKAIEFSIEIGATPRVSNAVLCIMFNNKVIIEEAIEAVEAGFLKRSAGYYVPTAKAILWFRGVLATNKNSY